MSHNNQPSPKEQYDEPGGLHQVNDDKPGQKDYPLDSVLIRTHHRTIYEVMRRINNKQYILDPGFQRDFVWNELKQSSLIESVIMRIPLPAFYFAEYLDGRTVVVDGLQRLTTLRRYLGNKFALCELLPNTKPQLEGLRFDDLPPRLKNRIEDTTLILYLIDSNVPKRIKQEILERVNP